MSFVLTLLGVPGFLQVPATPPTFPAETEVVHVEAMVTDKKGRPVQGLTAVDFSVFEDGKPVPIVAFVAPAPPGEGPSAAGAPVERRTGARPAPASDALTVVVYVDSRNLTTAGRRRALDGLGSLLAGLLRAGGVRVLVLAEQRGTRTLGELTDDPEQLGRALAVAAQGAALGDLARSDELTALELVKTAIETAQANCDEILPQLQGILRQHAQAREQQARETLARLAGVSAAIGALPGTKALLFLTENLEQRPGLALFHQLGDICPQAMASRASELVAPMQEFDLSRALQDLAARANAARVTIYPVDGGGLATFSVSDVSRGDRRYTPTPRNDSVRTANLKAGPWILAEETGGIATFDSNKPAVALGWIAGELHGRYTLGFSPARAADGRSHSLRLELARKGLKVRHRLSYFHAPSGEAQVTRTYAALLLGYEADELGAQIHVERSGAAEPAGVAIRISLPLDRLGTRPDGDARVAQLRVVMATRNAGEAVSEAPALARERTVEVRLPPTTEGGQPGATHDIVVRMAFAAEDQEVAVGVRDLIGGAASYQRVLVRR